MINDSLQSVTEFAEWFKSKYSSLDILVNNADIFCPDFKLLDGIESQMMVHHFSHFHLTLKLLPLFTESSRIDNVSSEAGKFIESFHVDFDSMNDPKWYSKFEAYKISKLANILFSKALLKRISPEKKILVHSLHPGRVATGIAGKVGAPARLKSCCVPIVHLFMMAKEDGALMTLYVATHPEVQRARTRTGTPSPSGATCPASRPTTQRWRRGCGRGPRRRWPASWASRPSRDEPFFRVAFSARRPGRPTRTSHN